MIRVQILVVSVAFPFAQILLEKACVCLFSLSYVLNSGVDWALSNQRKKKKPEFQTMGKAMGTHSAIFPKNVWKFTGNKEESLASHDRLCPEGISD